MLLPFFLFLNPAAVFYFPPFKRQKPSTVKVILSFFSTLFPMPNSAILQRRKHEREIENCVQIGRLQWMELF